MNHEIIMLDQKEKQQTIQEYRLHDKDTGSVEVQVALLTQRITHLTEHLRVHRKDFSTRRGLINLTNTRRKLLNYLKKNELDKYNALVKRLNLRR